MQKGGKQRQTRSSWWSSSEATNNWLGAVRNKLAKKSAGSAVAGVRVGVKQTKNSDG